ncbi:MAG: hypothetical protein JWP12_2376 [Bacteroidetes bacterium]|nr:hypothetical protein [Bacteroidota bacterium]
MKKQQFLWRSEKYFFALIVILTAIPVLCCKFFPTVDGPAHLYNGNLLKQLWFCKQSFARDFFDINTHLNSNFIDHVWFALAGTFLPSYLVEKSILLFYVVTLPYSFRFLAKRLVNDQHSARIASYLIFSFVYSFTFQIGFFNFSIGIPLVFWTLGLWVQHREQLTAKRIALLCFLTTAIYVSHIFNFLLLGIVVFVNELQYLIRFKTFSSISKKLLALTAIFIPGLILSGLFFISNNNFRHDPPSYLSKHDLIHTIIEFKPIITLSYDKERTFALVIGLSVCALLVLVILDYLKKRNTAKTQETHSTPINQLTNEPMNKEFKPFWIISTLIVLLLFFIFPDWVVSGGFISIRWALFFFYMLLIVIAAKGLPVKWLLLPVATMLVTHFLFLRYHAEQTKSLSADAEMLVEAEQHMDNNSVLLPLNFSTNWLQINFANYMATQKNIINLDNYEPTKPHFPLMWKQGEAVYDLMPGYGNKNPPCINIEAYEKKTHHRINYLSTFYFTGDLSDSCAANTEKVIKENFDLIYESKNKRLQLYERKQHLPL